MGHDSFAGVTHAEATTKRRAVRDWLDALVRPFSFHRESSLGTAANVPSRFPSSMDHINNKEGLFGLSE